MPSCTDPFSPETCGLHSLTIFPLRGSTAPLYLTSRTPAEPKSTIINMSTRSSQALTKSFVSSPHVQRSRISWCFLKGQSRTSSEKSVLIAKSRAEQCSAALERLTLQTSFANFLFSPPPLFIASLISPSLITKYGFGLSRKALQRSISSLVRRCRSVVLSLANFSGVVPFNAGIEYLGLSWEDGVDGMLVLPFVKGPFVGVDVGFVDEWRIEVRV